MYSSSQFETYLIANTCLLGPNTRNYAWADWEDWSECSVACGGDGTKTRTRSCIPPSNGGFDCPTDSQTETADCNNGPCPSNALNNFDINFLLQFKYYINLIYMILTFVMF